MRRSEKFANYQSVIFLIDNLSVQRARVVVRKTRASLAALREEQVGPSQSRWAF